MHIYLLRHTRPDVPPDTCYGQSDIDVVESTFRKDLEQLRETLPLDQIQVIFTSPLQRCDKLARSLHHPRAKYVTDRRIRELNFGRWELMPWSQINGKELQQWINDFRHAPAPGGESHMDLYRRAEAFWQDLMRRDEEHILVVTHGGVMKSLLSLILEMPLEKSYAIKLSYSALIYTHYHENAPQKVNFLCRG